MVETLQQILERALERLAYTATTYVPPLRGRDRLQKMVVTGGLVLLFLIPLVAFFIVQHLGRQ